MDSQFLKAGTILHNMYRIERVLGRGGFGITYLATDITLDRPVAIKEFFPKEYCDRQDSTSYVTLGTSGAKELVSQLKAKFLKEARNIAKLSHPGIIKVHSAFEENNTAYYVMEFIVGCSLAEWVRENGAMSQQKAVELIKQAGQALEYVHTRRINHLDVKPGNIMLSSTYGTPTLIDFGLSKQYDSQGLQTSSTPAGLSHGYAPIEQYKDGGVREFAPQTDVYSLGATLYYLVSEVRPPEAMTLVNEDLEFPAGFPEGLKVPISKAMRPRRCDRYPTVKDFVEALTESGNVATEVVEIAFDDEKTNVSENRMTKVVENKAHVRPRRPDPEIGVVSNTKYQSLNSNYKPSKVHKDEASDDWKELNLVSIDVQKPSIVSSLCCILLISYGVGGVGLIFGGVISGWSDPVMFYFFLFFGIGCIPFLSYFCSRNYKKFISLCQWWQCRLPKNKNKVGDMRIFTTANKKFGVFNKFIFKVVIKPEYDKMDWYIPGKILKVQKGNEIFHINLKNKKVVI